MAVELSLLPRRVIRRHFFLVSLLFFVTVFASSQVALADGVSIDKIYDPYVEQLEREIELRATFYEYDNDFEDFSLHRLGLGASFAPNWFGEVYLIGEKEEDGTLTLDAYELEAKWQLTEQGEYAFDWGLLFEFEDRKNSDIFEFSTAVLTTYEINRWVTTSNIKLKYEWSDDVDNEFESALSLQTRYRYQQSLEFGLEFYGGEDTRSLGPVLTGGASLSGRKKMFWELGLQFGLDADDSSLTPDYTFRALLEFEF